MSAHFTSGLADHVANLNPPRPFLFAVSGAVDCATSNGWMRVTGPWCLKGEVSAQVLFWSTLPMKLVSTLQKERGALAAVNIMETFLDDWVRSGKCALS